MPSGAPGRHRTRIAFHARGGEDLSGKGDLVPSQDPTHKIYGALYEIDAAERPALDRFEGRGHRGVELRFTMRARRYTCFAYAAESPFIDEALRPYDWYKALVLLGARHLGLPRSYVNSIEGVSTVPDPDRDRRQRLETLIGRMALSSRAPDFSLGRALIATVP